MGIVSYGQSGYAGASMSVRARQAYESGEMPMSKWTRGAIISAIKDYCADFDLAYNPEIESKSRTQLVGDYLEYKSWHHTGRFARETEFFGLNEDAVCADFPEMTPDQIAERNDKATAAQAAASEWNSFMKARENAFAKRFGCNASSVLAYEAFHPERCTRFLVKRSKREMIGYELPDRAADRGMRPEQTCPVELAARSHVACFNAFRDGVGGESEWHDLDFDAVAELFDERGLDELLAAKSDEAELSEDLGLVGESDCR